MVRALKYILIILAAIVLLAFCLANHEDVTLSFDPFGSRDNPAFSITTPLFVVVIASAMVGVVAGAFATWLSQGRHRRASRQNRAEAARWRAQAEALNAVGTGRSPDASLPRRE
jgi:uncharacterized integral membrane protein